MGQFQLDTDMLPNTQEGAPVDGSLKSLWDKIHSVVEVVNQLKSVNAALLERNELLTEELDRTKLQFETQLTGLHSQNEKEVHSLKSQQENEAISLKKFYESELTKLRSMAETELESTRTSLETALREVQGRLETELNSVRNQLSVKDQDMKRLRAEYSQMVNANENGAFTKEEKEILRNRIRELIAKINSHI